MLDSLRSWATGPAVLAEAWLVVATVPGLWGLPRSLRTGVSEHGLVSLAFAQTPSRAREIRHRWERIGRLGTARRTLNWEVVLIALYAATLLLGLVLAARLADVDVLNSTKLDWVLDAAVYVVGGAVLFDALENTGCWWMLHRAPNPLVTAATWNFAFIKFALLAVATLGALGLAVVGALAALF